MKSILRALNLTCNYYFILLAFQLNLLDEFVYECWLEQDSKIPLSPKNYLAYMKSIYIVN